MRVHIAGDVAGGGAARCAAETLPRLLLQLLLGQAVRSVPRPVCLGAVKVAPLLPKQTAKRRFAPALPWHDRLRARPAACPGLAGMLMMACAVHGSLLTLQNFSGWLVVTPTGLPKFGCNHTTAASLPLVKLVKLLLQRGLLYALCLILLRMNAPHLRTKGYLATSLDQE